MEHNEQKHCELVVIGGGPGGYAAAFLAADLGMSVTLVEQRPRLGGACLLEGCIPSKALLHVARVISETREVAEWGVDVAAPRIDLAKMRDRKAALIKKLSDGLKQLAKRRKVRVIHARAEFEDSQRLRLTTNNSDVPETISFDRAIVATGSRPALPKSLWIESPRVVDSTGALELRDVPERLMVIGGGYIGLELGTVYAELGSKVTVVEMTDTLLPGVDRDLVKPLRKRLDARLEAIQLGTTVKHLTDTGEAVDATLVSADGESTEAFDRVLVAVGRRPNTDELGLDRTNAVIGERGFLTVDDQLRTSDGNIWAIGDVAGEPMLAHKATHDAKRVVEAMSGRAISDGAASVPAVVFTDPEIAWVGLTETQAKADDRPCKVSQYPWAASGRAQAIGRTEGLTKIIVDPNDERLLGIGIVGPGAGDLIGEATLALDRGCTASDLAAVIHAHPTLSETLGNAAEVYLGLATEVYRPRREWRK